MKAKFASFFPYLSHSLSTLGIYIEIKVKQCWLIFISWSFHSFDYLWNTVNMVVNIFLIAYENTQWHLPFVFIADLSLHMSFLDPHQTHTVCEALKAGAAYEKLVLHIGCPSDWNKHETSRSFYTERLLALNFSHLIQPNVQTLFYSPVKETGGWSIK